MKQRDLMNRALLATMSAVTSPPSASLTPRGTTTRLSFLLRAEGLAMEGRRGAE